MNYFKMQLKSNAFAYGVREYFPYTDKPFFKSLDDFLIDETLQDSLAHLFVKLYKDELTFEFDNFGSHKYITYVKHNSNKFTKINKLISEKIAKILKLEILSDYFLTLDIPRVDIRDEYIKNDFSLNILVNKKYLKTPVIIFDCCCSTGIIFDYISNIYLISSQNIYLSYGVRYNCHVLDKTYINSINEIDFDTKKIDVMDSGYIVRIYGLFGNKNVEVDFRNPFSIVIGENGYGKSTAVKLAVLALNLVTPEAFGTINIERRKNELLNLLKQKNNDFEIELPNMDNELGIGSDTSFERKMQGNQYGKHKEKIFKQISNFYFDKIEIYHSDYYYDFKRLENLNFELYSNEFSNRVYHNKFGCGTIVNKIIEATSRSLDIECENKFEILFDDANIGKKLIVCSKVKALDENGNIKDHMVCFVDAFGFCFHEQLVKDGDCVNDKEFKKMDIINLPSVIKVLSKKIESSQIITLDDFVCDYEYLKKIGTNSTVLIESIYYQDTIPSKATILETTRNNSVKKFLNSLNDLEYNNILRKNIINDRSIEIDYNSLAIKYNLDIDFNSVDKFLRNKLKNRNVDDNLLLCNDIIYFNCTKSRNILSKPPRDRIKLDYYSSSLEYDFDSADSYTETYIDNYEETLKDYENQYDEALDIHSNDDYEYYKRYDETAFDYDDPDEEFYNPYEDNDDIYDEIETRDYSYEEDDALNEYKSCYEKIDVVNYFYSLPSQQIAFKPIFNGKALEYIEEIDLINFFETSNISVHEILHNFILADEYPGPKFSNFFVIIDKIISFYNGEKIDEKIIINAAEIEKYYNDIFQEYHKFSFGVYELISKKQFDELHQIINKLRVMGLKEEKDYIVVAGLYVLLDIMEDFKSPCFLLEKMLNKYLINKKAIIYPNSFTIVDENNEYIPINMLSTGERNLIILFLLCFVNSNKLIVLDEPDLSMSVDWQSKILVDLLKYTNNYYIVISQSPLLIQKNNLSTYVKRMDFNSEIELIDATKLGTVEKNTKYKYGFDKGIKEEFW